MGTRRETERAKQKQFHDERDLGLYTEDKILTPSPRQVSTAKQITIKKNHFQSTNLV